MTDSIHDLTNKELRRKIAEKTGRRMRGESLTKEMLNSAYAWFTGEFYEKPAHVGPGSPRRDEVLAATVRTAADLSDDSLLENYYDDVRQHTGPYPARAMHKDELVAFVQAMIQVGDQREWMP